MLLSLLIALPLFYVLGGRSVGALYRAALQRARRDGLTDLDNHRAFQDELARAVGEAARYGTTVTLALLDIDDFKFENDRHGHQHGDRLLCELAALLREQPRRRPRVPPRRRRVRAAARPHRARPTPTSRSSASAATVERRLSGVTTSIGFSAARADDREPSSLWGRADAALLEAKRRGGNAIVASAEVADSVPVVTIEKVRAVRSLIDAGAVDVAFQPIWDLGGTRVLGYEALARPRSRRSSPGPARRSRSPTRSAAATSSTRSAAARRCAPPPTCRRARCCSSTSRRRRSSTTRSPATASCSPCAAPATSPSRSCSRSPSAPTRARSCSMPEAARLRALGFKLALDDVGAGNAGLEMLRALPVDFIKIDRAVVANAVEDRGARAVMLAIMAFARESGSFVIAEGIETEAMLELARDPRARRRGPPRRRPGRPGLPARPARARARARRRATTRRSRR